MRETDQIHEMLHALEDRLRAAERVCVLVGINAVGQGERGKALTQSWMDWNRQYGPSAPRVSDELIAVYAHRRDEITEATLARIRESRPAVPAGESTPEVTE